MPKSKARKNVDESFKVAAVQRLQTGGVPAKDLAKELGVSIWSLRRWSRQYRKRKAAGAGAAREPAAAPKEILGIILWLPEGYLASRACSATLRLLKVESGINGCLPTAWVPSIYS